MNNVSLVGRLVRDLELRYTQNGVAFARLTVAVDKALSKEKRQELQNANKPTANFVPCVVWGKLAENMANYTGKGSLVAIGGEIETGSYQNNEGRTVYTTEVRVSNVQFLESGKRSNNQGQNVPANNMNNEQIYQAENGDEGFFPIDNDDIPF
ncbi:single-stranded DNA-binding protein [Peptoniphilus sp.]